MLPRLRPKDLRAAPPGVPPNLSLVFFSRMRYTVHRGYPPDLLISTSKEETVMAVIQEPFGATREGQAVDRFILRSGAAEAEIITFGAALRTLLVPDRSGKQVDVVLGYDDVSGYQRGGGYLGAVVGRYANRIAGGSCLIDGRRVPLEVNEGPKQLHGGPQGFSHRVFQARQSGESAVTLTYDAADGEGGFPGALTLHVTYTL